MKLGNLSFSLRKLRQRDITLVIIALTAILGLLWFFYMFRPSQERIEILKGDIERLNTEIQRGETAQRSLPQLREQLAIAEAERADFLRQLPTESEVAALITTLRLNAGESGLLLQSLSQGRGSNESIPDVRPMGFALSTTGNYAPTMAFLNDLERLERFTKVQQVSLSRSADDEDNPELNATFDFTVYVFTGQRPEAGR